MDPESRRGRHPLTIIRIRRAHQTLLIAAGRVRKNREGIRMEGNPHRPISGEPVDDSDLEDQTIRAHLNGFPAGDSAGGGRRGNRPADKVNPETPSNKRSWIALLALALVII